MADGGVEYLQARLSARYGARPDEAAWSRLEGIRELGPLLRYAGDSAFRPWVAGLTAGMGTHSLESTLRRRWRGLVGEVQRWLPAEWRTALGWWSLLPELPLIAHLLEGGATPPWVEADRELAALAAALPAPLVAAHAKQRPLAAAWLEEGRRLRPPMDDEEAAHFAALDAALMRHDNAFAHAAPAEAWPLRRALAARADRLFRRALLSPAAAFAFLLQAALDLERLRGELSRRAAFPPLEATP